MSLEDFGRTPDGKTVHRVRIAGGGLQARVMNWGAAIQDLSLAGHADPLVLGFETFDPYPAHSPFFGAIAGRYANRIRAGRFTIDGERYQADTNFLGKHLLHGGGAGFWGVLWTVGQVGPDFVTLGYVSPAGEMGFPGTLKASCTYRCLAGGRLVVELEASTDLPTLCNLAHHSYFNLENGGRSGIVDHRMSIRAHAYLPVDDELIPTGHVVPVEGTPFDFLAPRTIRDRSGQGYDHNFCISAGRQDLRQVAWAQGPSSGVEMEVWSTEPGLQFYDGVHVARDVPGLRGIAYGAHAGFCLEPQVWPDAPNRPYFPEALLRPDETYCQTTEYRFRMTE